MAGSLPPSSGDCAPLPVMRTARARLRRPLLLKPGSRLVRRGARTHTIVVLDDGLEHEGSHYRSLTVIARHITGAHWSGPRFIGLRSGAAQPRAKNE